MMINPERRDPGKLKNKSDVGLSKVDNISSVDLINSMIEESKIIHNRKKEILSDGGDIVGLLETSLKSFQVNFIAGLFSGEGDDAKELAQFGVNLYCEEKNEKLNTNYELSLTEDNEYLNELSLVILKNDGYYFICLKGETDKEIRVNLVTWTEGIMAYDGEKALGNDEKFKVSLDKPSSTISESYGGGFAKSSYNADSGILTLTFKSPSGKKEQSHDVILKDLLDINDLTTGTDKYIEIKNQETDKDEGTTVINAKTVEIAVSTDTSRGLADSKDVKDSLEKQKQDLETHIDTADEEIKESLKKQKQELEDYIKKADEDLEKRLGNWDNLKEPRAIDDDYLDTFPIPETTTPSTKKINNYDPNTTGYGLCRAIAFNPIESNGDKYPKSDPVKSLSKWVGDMTANVTTLTDVVTLGILNSFVAYMVESKLLSKIDIENFFKVTIGGNEETTTLTLPSKQTLGEEINVVSEAKVSIKYSAENNEIYVPVNYTCTCSEDWFYASPSFSGIRVIALDNTEETDRSGTLTITQRGTNIQKKITITQSKLGVSNYFEINNKKYYNSSTLLQELFLAEGETKEFHCSIVEENTNGEKNEIPSELKVTVKPKIFNLETSDGMFSVTATKNAEHNLKEDLAILTLSEISEEKKRVYTINLGLGQQPNPSKLDITVDGETKSFSNSGTHEVKVFNINPAGDEINLEVTGEEEFTVGKWQVTGGTSGYLLFKIDGGEETETETTLPANKKTNVTYVLHPNSSGVSREGRAVIKMGDITCHLVFNQEPVKLSIKPENNDTEYYSTMGYHYYNGANEDWTNNAVEVDPRGGEVSLEVYGLEDYYVGKWEKGYGTTPEEDKTKPSGWLKYSIDGGEFTQDTSDPISAGTISTVTYKLDPNTSGEIRQGRAVIRIGESNSPKIVGYVVFKQDPVSVDLTISSGEFSQTFYESGKLPELLEGRSLLGDNVELVLESNTSEKFKISRPEEATFISFGDSNENELEVNRGDSVVVQLKVVPNTETAVPESTTIQISQDNEFEISIPVSYNSNGVIISTLLSGESSEKTGVAFGRNTDNYTVLDYSNTYSENGVFNLFLATYLAGSDDYYTVIDCSDNMEVTNYNGESIVGIQDYGHIDSNLGAYQANQQIWVKPKDSVETLCDQDWVKLKFRDSGLEITLHVKSN